MLYTTYNKREGFFAKGFGAFAVKIEIKRIGNSDGLILPRELLVMGDEYFIETKRSRLGHLASYRSISRYSTMMSSTIAIASAKSLSY